MTYLKIRAAALAMVASLTQRRSLTERYVMRFTMVWLTQVQATFFGQPICAVVATTPELARRAANAVDVDYEPLDVIATIKVGCIEFSY